MVFNCIMRIIYRMKLDKLRIGSLAATGGTSGVALALFFILVTLTVPAITDNPYSDTITSRNAFGIKPVVAVAPPPVVPPPAPKVQLQGITTILGKKLVLFKAVLPAKPPEQPQPKEVSLMLSEGQREGEIEVMEINVDTGNVKLKNYGVEQSLNLKDDAAKPVVMAAPTPVPLQAGAPGVPPPIATSALPAATGGSAVTTFGNSSGTRTIPTARTPRTGIPGMAASSAAIQQQPAGPFNREAQIINMELERELHKNNPRYPPPPPTIITPPPPAPE